VQFDVAQSNLVHLGEQLQATATEAVVSKERLAALEEERRKQAEQAAALRQQLGSLQQSNQVVLAEKNRLATELQVAEVEKRHATEQVVKMEEQVKVEREEKARLIQHTSKLADDVKVLASRSGQLAEEIRENRPLAPNTIFDNFLTNRVRVDISALRKAAFGLDASKHRDTSTILVSNGTNTYALLHVDETPFTFWNPGTDWEGLVGTLRRARANVPVHSVIFGLRDPRLVLIPVSAQEVEKLGANVYHVSAEPFKYQDAVLVGAAGYYGECRFQIDPTTPGYVRLDNNFIKGIFGKFNPSRGDLVFSRTGELLGIMANSTYAMMLQDFHGSAMLQFAENVRDQRTGFILSQLYASLNQMPSKLQ